MQSGYPTGLVESLCIAVPYAKRYHKGITYPLGIPVGQGHNISFRNLGQGHLSPSHMGITYPLRIL